MGGGVSHEQAEDMNAKLTGIMQRLDRLETSPRRETGDHVPSPPKENGSDGSSTVRKKKAMIAAPGEEVAHTPSPPPKKSTTTSPRDIHFEGVESPKEKKPGPTDKTKVNAAKQKRKEFFGALKTVQDVNSVDKMPGVKCVWLSCAALGIHFTSGVEVKLEHLLKVNSLALHYVSFPSVTLAELFDVVAEFLDSDPRMRAHDIRAEIATFDSETVDEAEDATGSGDRNPVPSLAAFRKEMAAELANPHSIYILNFDPYIVQEAEVKLEEDLDEEEDHQAPKRKQWAAKNMGHFALLTAYNPALHSVTLATPHLSPDGKMVLETHSCSLQTLYQATVARDGYTKRPRGFVRVFRADEHAEVPVKSMFPVATLDGRNAKGCLTTALDVAIAPHLLGLGLLHHLVTSTFLLNAASVDARRRSHLAGPDGAKGKVLLSGIMVSDIAEVLQLPVSAIVAQSNKNSLPLACAWYQRYLMTREVRDLVHIGFVPISRRDGADDGAVNVDEEDFFHEVIKAVSSDSLMLVNFDINVAQNVVVTDATNASHFAVVVGVDDHRGIVKLADVSVKKYRKVWHLPLMRLYNAVIGYGYMIVANDEAHANGLGAVAKASALLEDGRYKLPALSPSFFEYPRRNYTVTVLASVLTQMGFATTVENLLYGSGFHLSFLLSEHIPMLDAARLLSYYSRSQLDNAISVLATNMDSEETLSLDAFAALVKGSSASKKETGGAIVVFFDPAVVQTTPSVWNGSNGGSLAEIVGYDSATGEVTLADANPDAYYRYWTCPLKLLKEACRAKDRIADRSRGFLRISRHKKEALPQSKNIDIRRAMSHHPFKQPISAAASSIALGFSELLKASYSAEDILYSSPNFDLGTLTAHLGVDDVLNIANNFAKCNGYPVATTKLCDGAPENTVSLEEGVADDGIIDIVVYRVTNVFGEALDSPNSSPFGAGVVIAVDSENGITVADGNPTRFGATWTAQFGKLHDGFLGILRMKK